MGLHMGNIVEHQSTDGDVLEIVEARRRGSGPAERLAQLIVVGVIRQRDVGEEAARLVLERAQGEQVVHPVRHGFDMAVQHRAVRRQADPVRLPMHRQPFLAGELLVGNGGARGGAEYFGAATGKARDAGVFQGDQDVRDRQLLDAREVRDLDRCEGLDMHSGVARLEAAEHVDVVAEPQLGMQAPHDVKLARRVIARRVGLGEDLVETPRVRAFLLRHARKGAEDARVAQHAHVRGVDVLIRGEAHAVAVAPAVHLIGEPPNGEQIVRVEQRERVVARQPLAALDLLRDGTERGPSVHYAARRMASVTLCPPNPKEFESATSTCRFTALLGAESGSQAGSGVNWLMVGGMTPVWTTRAQTPASNAPAAPSRWPVIDLVEPKTSFLARSPNTAFTAAVSAASPCGVEVPWALM